MREIEFTSKYRVRYAGGGEQGSWELLDDNTILVAMGGVEHVLKKNESDNDWVLFTPAREPPTFMRLQEDGNLSCD
jgi:hypothetical protein